jgi:hypothetical protein
MRKSAHDLGMENGMNDSDAMQPHRPAHMPDYAEACLHALAAEGLGDMINIAGNLNAQRPRITGWAQVNGRNALTWEQKLALDVRYVDHWSLWLDLKFIALTVWKILTREGIGQPGQATVREFMG